MSSSVQRALIAAVLGALSGIICSLLTYRAPDNIGNFLGVVFACSCVVSAILFWRPEYWRIVVAVAVIGVAWPLARELSVWIHGKLDGGESAMMVRVSMEAGNILGGAMTIAALAILARVWPLQGMTILALILGGAVVVFSVSGEAGKNSDPLRPEILFPFWQAAILSLTVFGLEKRRQNITTV
jgi:hypothetical protein